MNNEHRKLPKIVMYSASAKGCTQPGCRVQTRIIIIIIIIIKYLFASKTYSITSMVFYYLFKVPNSRLERKIKNR